MRKIVPENVRDRIEGIIDSLRSPGDGVPGTDAVQQPEREKAGKEVGIEPEAALRRARGRAFVRHARAVDAILRAQAQGMAATPEQIEELQEARTGFDKLRPHGSHDAEAVYKRNPELAAEAASGDRDRALPARRALQLETEMRQNPELRADRFVERFRELKQTGERQYAAAISLATGPYAPKWATWSRASNATRSLNPCLKAAGAISASPSNQAWASAATSPSATVWEGAEDAGSDCRFPVFSAVSTTQHDAS